MKHIHFFAIAFAGLFILISIGCANPDARYSMVEGTVTFNGEPVAGATVSFQPVSPDGESASGMTNASGRFTLTSGGAARPGSGALPGDYRVTIIKREPPPPDPDYEAYERGDIDYNELQERMRRRDALGSGAPSALPRNVLPARFASPGTSGLDATVVSGRNPPITFDLTD